MTETAAPAKPLTAEVLLAGLVDELSAGGSLTAGWRGAFRAVPRHLFVPDLIWRRPAGGHGLEPLRRTDQPDTWLATVYRDDFVVTQINDGPMAVDGASDVEYTSSTSMPSVVAEMLAALRVEPGMSALEIGTGTGWNAALLAHRLGGQNVTSVEIDPAISTHAGAAPADAAARVAAAACEVSSAYRDWKAAGKPFYI